MKIWIDLTDFLQWSGNLTGIQRVQYNLSKEFIASGKQVGFFIYDESVRAFTEVAFNPDEIVSAGIVTPARKAQKFPETVLGKVLRRIKPHTVPQAHHTEDVASPFMQGDMVAVLGGIWVGTFIDDLITCKQRHELKFIHFAFDMIPTLFPGYVVDWLPKAFGDYQTKVFTHADGIIAISQSTADDVRRFMQAHRIENKPKITVTRIGDIITKKDIEDNDKTEVAQLLDEKYILSVSTIEGRKNHAALFYAIKEAARRGIDLPKIVIAGRNGWLTDDIRYTIKNDIETSKNIVILNDIDDNQLAWLYRNCLFTVFPSFYEGWGMPIAESLAYGKFCLASNTSSMPEIAGTLIDYFSPYDTGELLEKIVEYLDNDLRLSKEALIAEQYSPTTWQEMYHGIEKFIGTVSES